MYVCTFIHSFIEKFKWKIVENFTGAFCFLRVCRSVPVIKVLSLISFSPSNVTKKTESWDRSIMWMGERLCECTVLSNSNVSVDQTQTVPSCEHETSTSPSWIALTLVTGPRWWSNFIIWNSHDIIRRIIRTQHQINWISFNRYQCTVG